MHKQILAILLLIFANLSLAGGSDALPPKQVNWPVEGFLGTFDRQAAQRGFQVYKEVCSTCHGLDQLSYRNLTDIGFSIAEVKQIASQDTVIDGPNSDGEMYERPGIPADRFVGPYKNEEEARSANNGSLPADLSLIVKARPDGANYLFSLLTGYADAPEDFQLM